MKKPTIKIIAVLIYLTAASLTGCSSGDGTNSPTSNNKVSLLGMWSTESWNEQDGINTCLSGDTIAQGVTTFEVDENTPSKIGTESYSGTSLRPDPTIDEILNKEITTRCIATSREYTEDPPLFKYNTEMTELEYKAAKVAYYATLEIVGAPDITINVAEYSEYNIYSTVTVQYADEPVVYVSHLRYTR